MEWAPFKCKETNVCMKASWISSARFARRVRHLMLLMSICGTNSRAKLLLVGQAVSLYVGLGFVQSDGVVW
jgi:putative NADH-flavin reductase